MLVITFGSWHFTPKKLIKKMSLDLHVCVFVPRMQTDWSPLPREVYEGLDSCADALSVLRRAEKLGKIVVTVPCRMVTDGAGTYVLSGGTGALGLCVSRRLIEEGAGVPWFFEIPKTSGFRHTWKDMVKKYVRIYVQLQKKMAGHNPPNKHST